MILHSGLEYFLRVSEALKGTELFSGIRFHCQKVHPQFKISFTVKEYQVGERLLGIFAFEFLKQTFYLAVFLKFVAQA